MDRTERAAIVLDRLRKRYPAVATTLSWGSPWELLVATILAAQCTDQQVNKVTPELFRRWPDVPSLAQADPAEVEALIRPTGFFRNKAKNLISCARRIVDDFGGEVPGTMAELTSLPGVARKTANIVLSNGFGRHEGIAVDTHVSRLAYRLGLSDSDRPERIEKDLMPLFPQEAWGEINHLLVWFGRDVCRARKPDCPSCELNDICPQRME